MKASSLFAGRPGLLAILLFILGIFIALLFQISYSIPLIILIISFFLLTYAYLKGRMRLAAWMAAILMILLGWYLTRLSSGPFPANHIENLAAVGERVELVGKVVEEPDIRSDKTYLVIEADSLFQGRVWIPTFGRVRASIKDAGARYQHADELSLTGFIYQPQGPRNPGAFDYHNYLRNKEIFAAIAVSRPNQVTLLREGGSFLSSVVSPLRNWLVTKTREYLSPLPAALLSGFILGEQRDIPSEYQDLFRNTGTLHLMAVSGSNVAFVLLLFSFPLTLLKAPRSVRVIILLLVLIFFAILTRLQPSVVRASIMAAVGLIAYGWIRKPDYINLLCLAGLLMLIWRPLQLFDVGVQLSFAATFGIIYAVPKINGMLSFLSGRWGKWLRNFIIIVASTTAAQLAVLPLMAHYFQNVPLSGVLANIPMILLAGFTTTLGIAFYFSTLLGGWLAHLISFPLDWMLGLAVIILRFFASLPNSNIKVASPGWAEIILIWLILYFIFELLAVRRLSKLSIVAILITANIFFWGKSFGPRYDWQLEFLDLGRNHAWIYSGDNKATVACFDSYISQNDADNVISPHLLNHHRGELDYLFTATPDSSDIIQLCSIFNPKIFSFQKPDSWPSDTSITLSSQGVYNGQSNFSANIKVVWGKSDNRDGCTGLLPALEIDIGEGSIVLADWAGAEIVNGPIKNHIRLLELPWSVYSQSSSLAAIERANPEVLVFSPDPFTQSMPRGRKELTHSTDRLLSTSIFGGFSINGKAGILDVETMKPIAIERK
jgi:ComEC/Rec2-related protein